MRTVNIIIICFLLIILIAVSFVSADWQYQETADEIVCVGNWDATQTCALTTDGDWDTYGLAAFADISYVYMNYTKPDNAESNSLWQVKRPGRYANESLPIDCWNYDANKLIFQIKSDFDMGEGWIYCYDGSWQFLSSPYGVNIYEEAMWWNITTPPDTCTPPETGDYTVQCADGCNWTINDNIPGNITFNGSGVVALSANWTFTGTNQYVYINPGCELHITSGGFNT